MKEFAPLVHSWSRYRAERQLDAHGHFFQDRQGEPGVLVDPVALHDGDAAQLRELGGVAAVVLTRADRVAEARDCRDAFGCPVLVRRGPQATGGGAEGAAGSGATAAADLGGLAGAETFGPGASLPGGLVAPAPDAAPGASPDGTSDDAAHGARGETGEAGETPVGWGTVVPLFHVPSGSALLAGSVVGAPAGELSLEVPPPEAPAAARRLRTVLAYWVRRVLVGEGEPVLRDADRALQDLLYRHDPGACLLRRDELIWQPPRGKGTRFLRRSGECSRLLGLRALDFEITVVPPGKQNTLLHRHDGIEEAFIVLEGEGELLTEGAVFPIRAGDVIGCPSRYPVAHAFRNTGTTDLRFLAFGAPVDGAEAVSLAEYPESNKQFQWVPGRFRRFFLPERQDVDYWEGERLDAE